MRQFAISINGLVAVAAFVVGLGWTAARAQSVPGTIIDKKGTIIDRPASPDTKSSPQPATGATQATTQTAASTANLDVVGIKIGMTIKDAMLALKADNPNLTLNPTTKQLEGFTQDLMPDVYAVGTLTTGKDYETVELLFTMAPSKELLWGVKRLYTYADQNKPTADNTIAALRKKYGPENVPYVPDPRQQLKVLGWVYDAQGKLMAAEPARRLYGVCFAAAGNYFGNGDAATFNEIQTGRLTGQAECNSIIMAAAMITTAPLAPGRPEYMVTHTCPN